MKGSCTEAEFRSGASRAIETRDLHAQVGYIRDRNGPRDGDDLCSIWVYAVTHTHTHKSFKQSSQLITDRLL